MRKRLPFGKKNGQDLKEKDIKNVMIPAAQDNKFDVSHHIKPHKMLNQFRQFSRPIAESFKDNLEKANK